MTLETSQDGLLEPGTVFGAYEIVRVLGAGAFGAVYEARRMPLGNRFALKVLHPQLASLPKTVARFMREAEATARIKHPHIVNIFEVGMVDRIPFLAMDYLEGETLGARRKREGSLSVEAVADIMVPICAAVAALHDRGVVHRDLKPDNVMLTEPRAAVVHPVVLDFGVARVLDPDLLRITTEALILGTPRYMSPEQLLGTTEADGRSDQWALGVILYECLCNDPPYTAKTLQELMVKMATESPIAPRVRLPSIAPTLDAIVVRTLQREPDDRYANVRQLGAALLPFASLGVRATWSAEYSLESASPPPTSVAPQRPRPPGASALGVRVAALAALATGVVALGLWGLRPRPSAPRPVDAAVAPVRPVVAAPVTPAGLPDAPSVQSPATPPMLRAPEPARVGQRVHNGPRVGVARDASAPTPQVVVGANGAVMR